MTIAIPPPVDPATVLKTARMKSKNSPQLRAKLITFSGVWLARKLDDLSAQLGPQEALLVQKALTNCGSDVPEPPTSKPATHRKPQRPKVKAFRSAMELPDSSDTPLRGKALLQRVTTDNHFTELMRLIKTHSRAFRLMLQANLSATARNQAITTILKRDGITSQETLTRLLSGHLEWTDAYVRDVMNATGLTAQELSVRTRAFLKR